jgi:hypothetical protein
VTVGRSNAIELAARVLVTAVPVASLAATVLLICGAFTAQRALAIGAVFAAIVAPRLRIPGFERWPGKGLVAIASVLIVALLLRWPPALYVQGGQDEGVYVSMAAHFAESGKLEVIDALRARLRDTDAVARYDANNLDARLYQPGFYINPATPGRYVPQFYPVHSLWLAMFGDIFGMAQAPMSQIFFGLVSLLFAALLAERIAGDWRAGVAFAALLSVLPLHVFFSKFPISEMPTLAFALMGWFALSCYQETTRTEPSPLWLVAAVIAFATVFFSRISGFNYLPVFAACGLVTQTFVDDRRIRVQWAIAWWAIAAAYALSVLYGLVYSRPYATDIYWMGFGALYPRLPWIVVSLAVFAVAAFAATTRERVRARLRLLLSATWSLGQRWGVVVLFAIVALGFVRIGVLAFTDSYQDHPWYDSFWHASHGGYDTWRLGALWVVAEHLSPFAAALLPLALWRPGDSPARALLIVFALSMTAYTALVQWFVPYQYYYARYYLSELVPYLLLLVIIAAYDTRRAASSRVILRAALACAVAYFVWYTWPLIGFREADGAYDSIGRIASSMDSDDVLLFDAKATPIAAHELVTPLRFVFERFVYVVHDASALQDIVHDLGEAGFGDIYYAGARGDPAPPGFARVDNLQVEQTLLEHRPSIPRESSQIIYPMTLYRLDAKAFASAELVSPKGLPFASLPADCCSGVYVDRMWTDGDATIRNLELPRGKWHTLRLDVFGYRGSYDDTALKVYADGVELSSHGFRDNAFTFDLGIEGPKTIDLRVSSSTFVPQQRGTNDDTRTLGVDIDRVSVQ